jgi:galactokinase
MQAVLDEVVAFAPGRVNLIGEHTDYNLGLALPFAIDQGITVRATRLGGRRIEAFALDLGDSDHFMLDDIQPAAGWRAFVRGAVAELAATGVELKGVDLQITGNLPLGGGLSSSAALAVALCLALFEVSGTKVPGQLELAQIGSRIEGRWAGIQSGLLDQLASVCGSSGSALQIDFKSLNVTSVPLKLDRHLLVILNSGDTHNHSTRGKDLPVVGYNRRREECSQACELLGLSSLREATPSMVEALPEPLASRAHHVLTENLRVTETVKALESADVARVGELLNESHTSLRDCYGVSTPAVERTVERLVCAGALGARIMGGGFGGHVLGLMPADSQLPSGAIEVRPGPGASLRPSQA